MFTTLLHEAVHSLADVRGVQDTSRQGRWHNQRFAKLAAELGMTTVKDDKLGFSPCTLTDDTAAHYQASINGLATALRAWRHVELPAEGKQKTNNNGLTAECECPRKIRLSQTAFEEGPIWCGTCNEAFLPDEYDRDAYNTDNPHPGPATDGDDQADDPETDNDAEEEDENVRFYDPEGIRFGLPTYPFKGAPDGLATLRQLRAQGLRPAGQDPAAQMLWRKGQRVAYLYRIDQAAPKRTATPRQRQAIDKALQARRTCPHCGQTKPYYIPRHSGECHDCTPERHPRSFECQAASMR